MSTKQIQTLKGFRDFLPKEARQREWLKNKMIEVFQKWGFEPLETPTLEPLELFLGQIGEDEKLFYQFTDNGGREVALRYDQTVPTCRVVGQYSQQLTFPFRRYQIQPAFRAEKPQKGRYREFIQADIDIFGVESALADAECIAVSLDLYQSLGFKKPIALINNRDLLKDIPYPVIAAIDKIKKIGQAGVIKEILAKGFSQDQAEKYLKIIENLKPDQTLQTIFDYLEKTGFSKDSYQFEPTLARSFSYSQGPIWEMVIPGYSTSSFGGSVGGGERYDGLVEKITGQKISGTGIAFGFDRTLEAAQQLGLIPDTSQMATQVLVTIFDKKLLSKSLQAAKFLREQNIKTEIYPEVIKLAKQIKYANKKNIKYIIIIGEDEAKKNNVTLKNMKTGEQKLVSLEEAVELIK